MRFNNSETITKIKLDCRVVDAVNMEGDPLNFTSRLIVTDDFLKHSGAKS